MAGRLVVWVGRSAAVSATIATGTAIAVSTTVTSAAAATTRLARASLVHCESTATDIISIEFFDGATAVVITHLHETKAAGAAGIAIGDDFC